MAAAVKRCIDPTLNVDAELKPATICRMAE